MRFLIGRHLDSQIWAFMYRIFHEIYENPETVTSYRNFFYQKITTNTTLVETEAIQNVWQIWESRCLPIKKRLF